MVGGMRRRKRRMRKKWCVAFAFTHLLTFYPISVVTLYLNLCINIPNIVTVFHNLHLQLMKRRMKRRAIRRRSTAIRGRKMMTVLAILALKSKNRRKTTTTQWMFPLQKEIRIISYHHQIQLTFDLYCLPPLTSNSNLDYDISKNCSYNPNYAPNYVLFLINFCI